MDLNNRWSGEDVTKLCTLGLLGHSEVWNTIILEIIFVGLEVNMMFLWNTDAPDGKSTNKRRLSPTVWPFPIGVGVTLVVLVWVKSEYP